MAAACQQASSSISSYEVFLSFRGEDVRTSFADHLYHALVGAGIRTFRDDEELGKGKEIAPNLHVAIQQSIIAIPILSVNYASSKWCLNELKEICECKKTRNQNVLPIFYKIEPTDVRNQSGVYAKAFDEEHPKQFDPAIVQKWRDVLQDIGKLDGWHIKEGSHEGKLVKEIIKIVSSILNNRLFHDSDKLVGIESHIKEMLKLLDIESEVTKILGIHGFGGIGKTTIARAVYNTVLSKFEEYAFIANVREDARKFGIQYLQNKFIALTLKDGSPNTVDVENGIKVIQERLRRKRVLVVLDDVDEDIQIESLIGDGEWFGIGSRIIVTSRDKNILITQKAVIYEPNLMNLDDSLELFCRYAFKRDRPQEDYLDLSKIMVKVTGRLPLALKTIGSSLFSKKKPIWEAMLRKLQKVPNNDVMERLKISYDGLEHAEKQMFLDTACFFFGMKKDIVCYIWESCDFFPQIGLDVLCAKSLITINEEDELRMHDVLRDLGREIVRRESIKPEERSRIWSKKEALDVLVKRQGTNKCIGLTISLESESKRVRLMSEALDAMTQLKLLQLDHAQILGRCRNSFSELRWLSWKACCSNSDSKLEWLSWKGGRERFALTNCCPKKLVFLDLSGSEMTEKWMGWNYIKMAVNLKVIKLESCNKLRSTPDFPGNRLLEILSFKDCENLVRVHTSIGDLTNLITLDMSGCISLESLPNEICKLVSLETLFLRECSSLYKMPDEWEVMISLKTLVLSGDAHVVSLPSGLTTLVFDYCESLQNIPNLPQGLTSLKFSHCNSLQNILNLPQGLTSLNFSYCNALENIPNLPQGLTSLNFSYCDSLQNIPNLPQGLTNLNFSDCNSLRGIQSLPPSLTTLKVSFCDSLQNITLGFPPSLTSLLVEHCYSLQYISGLPSRLRSLEVRQCKLLVKLSSACAPEGGGFRNLKTLYLQHCKSLEEIEGADNKLESLGRFEIQQCDSFKRLPKLRCSKNLLSLEICGTSMLSDFEGEGMDSLEQLKMVACYSLKKIPYLRDSKRMRELHINHCPRLTEIEHLESYESLEILFIQGVPSLKTLSNVIPALKNLTHLYIWCCISMVRLLISEDISTLKNLTHLYIWYCISMLRLPDLSDFKDSKDLAIPDCDKLREIQGLDRLESLQEFCIKDCNNLESLPDLSNFKKLWKLKIVSCNKLYKILGLHGLESLQDLEISYCNRLTEICGVERLKSLKTLRIKKCCFLKRLPDLSNLKYLEEIPSFRCEDLEDVDGGKCMTFLVPPNHPMLTG